MSGLDVFQNTQRDAILDAEKNIAPSLPAGFTESLDEAWRTGREWSASNAYGVARMNALDDYLADVQKKTGTAIPNPMKAQPGEDPSLDGMRQKLAGLDPAFGISPPSDEDIDKMTVQRMRDARAGAIAMASREKTWGGTAGGIIGGLGAGTLDPVNLALIPLGGLGEVGVLARVGEFAAIGAGAQAANEVLASGAREQAEPGYNASGEPVRNIVTAGIFGGALGGAFGLLGRMLSRDVKAVPTTVRDDVHVATSQAQVEATNPFAGAAGEMAHRDALVSAVGQIARGEPVTAAEGITPEIAGTFHGRIADVLDARTRLTEGRLPPTMERLSEVQVGEFNGTARAIDEEAAAARARLDTRAEALAADAEAFPARQQKVDSLTSEVESLRQDLQARQASIPPAKLDPETKARLQAIDDDLKQDGLTTKQRAALAREREQITQTLAAANPEQASIAQEIVGLQRALTKKERELTLAQSGLQRSKERAAGAAKALDRQRATLESRVASRRSATATELRKSIQRLGQEGYGLRVSREDADALAARVMGASEDDLDGVLRGITEELVTRTRTAENALPRRGANSDYWRNAMAERVQAYAKSAGHEMPPEDARAFAEQLSKMTETEVIQSLAEMTQRPITIAERVDTAGAPPLPPEAAQLRRGQAALRNAPDLISMAANDADGAAKMRDAPEVQQAAFADLDQIRAEKPDAEYRTAVLQPDGSVVIESRPLADVLDELNVMEAAAKDLTACIIGEAAE